MIDERTIELIHGDIDRELGEADRADLQQRLDADPQARNMHAQLTDMSAALARLPEVTPPGLHQQLIQATRPRARVISSRERRAQMVRYGWAMAAGMVLAVVGLSLTDTGRPNFDPGELAGTMGRQAAHPAGAVAARTVAAPGLNGSIALSPADDRWLLLFDLQSPQPVQVSATYDAAAFRLSGYAQGDSGVTSFDASPGRIGFVNEGAQRVALFLQPGAGGTVRIRFEGAGKVLDQAVLEVPTRMPAR